MNDEAYKKCIELGSKYSQDKIVLASLWKQLEKQYTQKNRYYHNLEHIGAMLKQSDECKNDLNHKDTIDFGIWFHDVIYKSTKKNNEEKSAEFAKETLKNFSIEEHKIEKVYNLILSTKKHQIIDSNDTDNAYMLDFDLSILGKSWKVYEQYIQQIRKEYKIYPDFLYKLGRKKVLKTFLDRKMVYFTEKYQTLYEEQARENLKKELKILNS